MSETVDQPLRAVRDLPGPPAWPYFGNLLQIRSTELHLQMEAWAERYGSPYRLMLGRRAALVITDHTQIAAALRDRPEGFKRTERLEAIWTEMGFVGGVFGANGDDWKRQRRMVMASFDPGHVRRFYPQLQRVAGRLVDRWRHAATARNTIDLQADLMRYTVDAIAGLAFGAEVNTLQSDEDVIQQHLNRIFPVLFQRLFMPFPLWRWMPSADDKALACAVPEVKAAVEGFISQARARLAAEPARREQPGNLLEAMIVAADAPDSGITDREVAGNVLVMLLAGEDTTANSAAWTLYLLQQNPEAMLRARDEVDRVLGGDELPSLDQLAALDYVEACTHEAMRLKPVAPQNTVQAIHETTVAGVRVPAKGLVMCVMRRDATRDDLLQRARAFNPARWLPDSPETATLKRVSMPFGAGPRICPGRYLALVEMKLAVAVTLRHFDIDFLGTADGAEPGEKLQLAMAPEGLLMRLAPRAAAAD